MITSRRFWPHLYIFLIGSFISVPVFGVEDIEHLYGGDQTVSIATGRNMPISHAPAVVTVVTREEMESIGATTLSEALELVPGVNTLWRSQGDYFVIRGIQPNSNFNPEVLILVDGFSQNDVHFGNQRKLISQIPWQNVERIEVIRGPGSSLYGADAFSGVINIVTRRAADLPTTEVRILGGSFNTAEARLLNKSHTGAVEHVLSLQLRSTDGHEPYIKTDAQTNLDQIFGTSASLAPDNMSTWLKDYNLLWDMTVDNWLLRLRTWSHDKAVSGITAALDHEGVTKSTLYSADMRYHNNQFSKFWAVQWDASYYLYDIGTSNVRGYPRGSFGGAFPDGVRDDPAYSESRTRTEVAGTFTGLKSHTTRLGSGIELARVFDIREQRNFTYSPIGLPVPIPGGMTEVPDSQLFSKEADRTLTFIYVQDEWTFIRDFALTSGLRYDYYSDFGGSFNPRLSLVWTTRHDLTTKILAGRAFRAPTLLDLNARNTPALTGNQNLKPVTITTYELAFDYRPTRAVRSGLNIFYHDIEDQITETPVILAPLLINSEGQIGHGLEFDVQWKVNDKIGIRGFYAYQDNELKDSGLNPGLAPRNSASLRIDWQFLQEWRFNTNVRWVADRKRGPGDARAPVDDMLVTDMTMRYKIASSSWEARLSVFNVFDVDAVDPSDSPTIYYDFPLPRRSVFAEIRTSWQ